MKWIESDEGEPVDDLRELMVMEQFMIVANKELVSCRGRRGLEL